MQMGVDNLTRKILSCGNLLCRNNAEGMCCARQVILDKVGLCIVSAPRYASKIPVTSIDNTNMHEGIG